MSNPIFGRGPNGRALRKDGTERKERASLSMAERLAKHAQEMEAAKASIGRKIFSNVENLGQFVSGIGIFRKWIRDAKSYASEDARNARREYFQRQLDTIDAKGAAAEKWLPKATDAIETISGLYTKIGNDILSFTEKNGKEPSSQEVEAIIRSHLSDDVRKIVEAANDPANDVFHGLRRDDLTDDSADDSDTL